MELLIPIFKLLAGSGLFLFAMYLIEESLKNLSGRNFKLFLQRVTKNKVGAVTGGAIVTGLLQSSSMVSIMVLAFVGAGVFTMKNALAIILGANLGTTLDSWLVATLGFKTNIEVIAYPAVFVGGLFLVLFGKQHFIKYVSYFLFGFGLLFISLSFMKTAMEAQVQAFDLSHYKSMPPLIFLGIGFLITLLVQSSSVTMALTLTALHVGAINFPSAAAIVLGSETGTTIKLLLSGIGGTASKKRVLLGNLLFNVVLTVIAFILLKPILFVISDVFKIVNPLIGLVTFSTIINLSGIILFLPFLDAFVTFLEQFFKHADATNSAFIGNADENEPETALDLFERETVYFIYNSMLFNLEQLHLDIKWLQYKKEYSEINHEKKYLLKTETEKYEFLKLLQGELQVFYLSFLKKINPEQYSELNRLASAARSCMYSVKCIKDLKNNIANLNNSSKNIKYDLFVKRTKQTDELYRVLNTQLSSTNKLSNQLLKNTFNSIQTNYSTTLDAFYKNAQNTLLDDMDMTTVINFNRQLFTSNKAIIMAVKDVVLDENEAILFNELAEYKT